MKKVSFMQKDICELLQLLQTIQQEAAQFPELQAQTAKLITQIKSLWRWLLCTNVSKHAIIITWLSTFACIVFESHGAPRIEQYSIPATIAMLGGYSYSIGKVKSKLGNLHQETEKFRIINRHISSILNHISSPNIKTK